MGSYSWAPNYITGSPSAAFDACGVRAAVTNDPAAAASGMPGTALRLSRNKANILASSSTRYRIGAGLSPNPSLPTVNRRANIGGGMEARCFGLEQPIVVSANALS